MFAAPTSTLLTLALVTSLGLAACGPMDAQNVDTTADVLDRWEDDAFEADQDPGSIAKLKPGKWDDAGPEECPFTERLLLNSRGDAVGVVWAWTDAETLFVETFALDGWELLTLYLYAAPDPMEDGLSTVLFPFADEPMLAVSHSRFELVLAEHDLDRTDLLHLAINARVAAVEEADVEAVEAWAYDLDVIEPAADGRGFVLERCD